MEVKLLDRVRQAIRARHYSRRTEEAYVHWIRRFIVFHKKAHPLTLAAPDVSAFLTWLAVDQRVSASTRNQALSAVLFLYREVLGKDVGAIPPVVRARVPDRLPVVLSRAEVSAVLSQLTGTVRFSCCCCTGAGLRVEECLDLRIKDVDLERHQVVVRRGKGQKDRVTPLPVSARVELARHIEAVRRLHHEDLDRGLGRVVLPYALERKYPNADRNGAGSSCFRRQESAAIRSMDRRRGITCTSRWCSERWRRLSGVPGSPGT